VTPRILPFLGLLLLMLAVLTFVPDLTLWLPRALGRE